jgi:hypothetical protein
MEGAGPGSYGWRERAVHKSSGDFRKPPPLKTGNWKPEPETGNRKPETGNWELVTGTYAASSTGSGSRTFATFRSLTMPTALKTFSVIQEMSNSYHARP